MKFNWKRFTALLLTAILMLAMTGLSEDEVTLEEGVVIGDDIAVEGASFDGLPTLEGGNLGLQLDDIELSISDVNPEEPATEAIDAPEKGSDNEAISNALITKVTIGVKEKYTINTSSLKGKLTFTSSDKKIATVTQKGVVVGKKVGTAKITITTTKKKQYTITVTVAKAPAKVTLNKKSASLKIGKTLQLKATLPKKTASNKMTWSSSDKSVATVTQKGKVTAKGEGTATITVKTFNGKKATCKVTVKAQRPEPTPVSPTISIDNTDICLSVGETETVRVAYTGDNSLYCSTSVTDIVSCVWDNTWNNGTINLYLEGINGGSTTVTIHDDAAGYSVSINVTVIGGTPTPTPESTPAPTTLNKTIHFASPTVVEMWENMVTVQEYRVDVFEYEIIPVGGGFKCKLSFGGVKTSDIYGSYNATKYPLNWHLYDRSGTERAHGVIWTPVLCLNDRWYPESCTTYTSVFDISFEPGNISLTTILSQ